MRKYLTIALFSVLCMSLHAQEQEAIYEFDTLGKPKSIQFVGLPFIFSTPETSFGFGAGAQLFLLRQTNADRTRLSNILVSAVYTLKNQVMVDVKPQIYFANGDYFLDGAYTFKIFPNSFWGIGNFTPESNIEPYNQTSHEFRVAFLRRLPPSLNFGFEFFYNNYNVTEVDSGGILEMGEVLGSDGAIASGLGAIFNLDTRSSIEAPVSGYFLQINAGAASRLFGSTFSYNKFKIDLRTYRKVGKNGIIAFQIYSESTFGEVPFQTQAIFGGGERARGYFRGRFIDNQQYVVQAEYRLRFKPRWVVAAYALVGEVADLPRNFFQDLKPAIGGGIRFKIIKSQNTHVRLDYGFGKNGSSGFYFGVNEAF